ncbi:hypothetical protein SmJEL517_g01908 [Synchytrium microbalum]|uniref:Uncharacterized protein n=1 Tax=Synchytrium microbalum TaxID=1806994 RepID=A0A507CDP4_9FUNG|nr:uncharacterized protein SmJEL517_g01908 [Synchytrium microbalum]TPX35685.1 hypothetical protein SmJEL517_g01908 [Synchytrium microbalum]
MSYDIQEKSKQETRQMSLGLSIAEYSMSTVGTLVETGLTDSAKQLLDELATIGLDASLYIKEATDIESMLCLIGLALDYKYPLESFLPSVTSLEWVLDECLTSICLQLDRFQEDHFGMAGKAVRVLEYLAERTDLRDQFEDGRPDEIYLKTFQNLLVFAATIPEPAYRNLAYTTFKKFLLILNESARSYILLALLESSPFVGVQTAILAVLKDQVHLALAVKHERQEPSPFGSSIFTNTFLVILLDPRESIYRSTTMPDKTIFDVREVFMERHSMLMHTINLYLYLLLRDTPYENIMGVWSETHIESTSRTFLTPLHRHCDALLERISGSTTPEDAGHTHGEHSES